MNWKKKFEKWLIVYRDITDAPPYIEASYAYKEGLIQGLKSARRILRKTGNPRATVIQIDKMIKEL